MTTPAEKNAIENFASVAREFCMWVECKKESTTREIRACRELLLKIHTAVIQLPQIEPETVEPDRNPAALSYEWVTESFGLWPLDNYWEISEPLHTPPDEAVCHSAVSYLAEIYSDLMDGLVAFDAGRIEDANFDWATGFEVHWGHHMVGLQRALHEYLTECVAD